MTYSPSTKIANGKVEIADYLPAAGEDAVIDEILSGLKATPKYISSKYFYDKSGSRLFEEITKLDEYYPTRSEKKILATLWDKLHLEFNQLSIVELGSGDPSKIRLLLRQIPAYRLARITYIPIDISRNALEWAVAELEQDFPDLQIHGIATDFLSDLSMIPKPQKRLFCFLGGTVGNFNPEQRKQFLNSVAAEMRSGDHLLLGIDMVKDETVLERAYNDSQQITAAFNRNILNVVNRHLKADFNPLSFAHIAFYNRNKNRIEMHLKAQFAMEVQLKACNEIIRLQHGEMIHTENSYKFTSQDIDVFASCAGLQKEAVFTDENKWFSIVHFRKP